MPYSVRMDDGTMPGNKNQQENIMAAITAAIIAQAIIVQNACNPKEHPDFEVESVEEEAARELKSSQHMISRLMMTINYLTHVTGRQLKAAEIAACDAIAGIKAGDDDDADYDYGAHVAMMQAIAGYAAGKE